MVMVTVAVNVIVILVVVKTLASLRNNTCVGASLSCPERPSCLHLCRGTSLLPLRPAVALLHNWTSWQAKQRNS
jgi:hypothetical protein